VLHRKPDFNQIARTVDQAAWSLDARCSMCGWWMLTAIMGRAPMKGVGQRGLDAYRRRRGVDERRWTGSEIIAPPISDDHRQGCP
jgi:hypothetical protein